MYDKKKGEKDHCGYACAAFVCRCFYATFFWVCVHAFFCLNWCRMFSINSIDKFTTCHAYVDIQGSPAWNPGFLIGLPRCHSVALLLWLPFASKH